MVPDRAIGKLTTADQY